MAIIRKIEEIKLEKDSKHTEVESTYSIVNQSDGKYLQIDTYGSNQRQIQGKKSQSIRLAPEAINELVKVIKDNQLSSEI